MSQTKVEAPFIQRNAIFRNKFCNGDFQVHQRFDGSATAASTAYMSFDRIKTLLINTGAAWTIEKETLSVTDLATTGHKQALEVKCTTADTSTGAAEYNAVFFSLEANSLQDLNYGTSAAKSLTVSFWVRSYQTGTFILTAAKSDSTTYYNPKEYTINASNTWEHKVLTFSPTAGGTSLITSSNGAIPNDNGQGMHFYFLLNAGSNYHATNDTWATSGIATSNQTNMMSSTDNHWSITGLQIEVGDQATDFEYLPFDIQLQRCLRYFFRDNLYTSGVGATGSIAAGQCNTTTRFDGQYDFPVLMRARPTGSVSGADKFRVQHAGSTTTTTGVALEADGVAPSFKSTMIYATVSSGLTAGRAGNLIHNNATAYIDNDAEF
tara:strand:+ start:133 stop:1269 length:1137 start_codon:yes stop_codon:yes gene_type:complete